MECAAYAATPSAIAAERAWLFTLFRVLSGGGFATLNSNTTPLLARVFGLADLHGAVAVTSWFEPLSGFSATLAWAMHIRHTQHGGAAAASYDAFFRLSAAIVGAAAVLTLALAAHQRRADAAAAALSGGAAEPRP